MDDRLQVGQRGPVAEHDGPQARRVDRAEALLDAAPNPIVIGAQLTSHRIGLDDGQPSLAQHAGHRALPAAHVAG